MSKLSLALALGANKQACPADCPLLHTLSSYNHGYSWECGLTREKLELVTTEVTRSPVLLRNRLCKERATDESELASANERADAAANESLRLAGLLEAANRLAKAYSKKSDRCASQLAKTRKFVPSKRDARVCRNCEEPRHEHYSGPFAETDTVYCSKYSVPQAASPTEPIDVEPDMEVERERVGLERAAVDALLSAVGALRDDENSWPKELAIYEKANALLALRAGEKADG